MSLKKSLLFGTSVLAVNFGIIDQAYASCIPISTNATVTGPTGCVAWSSGNLSLTNAGTLTTNTGTAVVASGNPGTLTNTGLIHSSDAAAISNSGTIASIINSTTGRITLNSTANSGQQGAILNNGGIGNITNSGLISGQNTGGNFSTSGIYNFGSIGTITNNSTGTISASASSGGITNYGTLGTVSNSGTISGTGYSGILNGATINTILNNSTGTLTGGNNGLYNIDTVGSLTNDGKITGGAYGIYNNTGTINSLTNTGTISSVTAVWNRMASSTIGSLTNSGTISGTNAIINEGTINSLVNNSGGTITSTVNGGRAIYSTGSIGALQNNAGGVISANTTAVYFNGGTVGTITNSGLISGQNAILVGGTLTGALNNSGTIIGNIDVSQNLTINGGTGLTFGTLTGGSIFTSNHNLTVGAGNVLLGDNINLGTGTLTNQSTLRLNAPQSITGSFSQGANSTLVVAVGLNNTVGQLVVSGTANMANSNVKIVPYGNTSLFAGERLFVVQANSGSDYSNITASALGFTSARTDEVFTAGLDELFITLGAAIGSVGTYQTAGAAAGGVGASMGAVLDQIQNNGNTAYTALLGSIDGLSGTAQANAIKSLAPNQVGAQLVSTNIAINAVADILEDHQYAMLDNSPASMAAGSEYRTGSFWGQVMGGDAIRSSDSSTDGFRQEYYGLTVGADTHVSETSLLGAAFSWTQGQAYGSDASSGDKLQVDSYQLSGYGAQRWDNYYINGLAGIAYNHFQQDRYVVPVNQVADSDYNGWQETAKIEGGRNFALDGFTLTPLASLQAVYTQNDGYTESGAGVANLGINKQYYDAYESDFGVRATTKIDTGWGRLLPEAKLSYVHDWTNNIVPTSGILGGVNFSTSTAGVSRNGAQLVIGATLQSTDNLSLRAEYDGDFRSDYEASTGMLKAAWNF